MAQLLALLGRELADALEAATQGPPLLGGQSAKSLSRGAALVGCHGLPTPAKRLAFFAGELFETLAALATALALPFHPLAHALALLGVHLLKTALDMLAPLFSRHLAEPLASLAPSLGRNRFNIARRARTDPGRVVPVAGFGVKRRAEPKRKERNHNDTAPSHVAHPCRGPTTSRRTRGLR